MHELSFFHEFFPAHPRSRGEHIFGPPLNPPLHGSSPLARGTSWGVAPGQTWQRLIPARAGNITAAAPKLDATAAHPRSRGEHEGAHNILL